MAQELIYLMRFQHLFAIAVFVTGYTSFDASAGGLTHGKSCSNVFGTR